MIEANYCARQQLNPDNPGHREVGPKISMILWLLGGQPPPHKPLVVKFVYANFAVTSIESLPSPSNAQSLASRPSADGDPARVTLPLVSYTERRF